MPAWSRTWQWNIQIPGLSAGEGDIPRLTWADQDRVDVHRAALERRAVLRQHRQHVTVQMHRVELRRVVDDVQLDDLPLLDVDRWHVGRGLAIDRVNELWPTFANARLLVQHNRYGQIWRRQCNSVWCGVP